MAHANPDARELAEARQYLQDHGIATIEVPQRATPKSGVGFYGRLAANLASLLPYSVTSHRSAAMVQTLSQLAEKEQVDVWHCEWTPYAESFRGLAAKPLVIAAHNVESLIWKRMMESESNPVKRWYIRQQWKKYEDFERWAFSRARTTIFVSSEDARLATESYGATAAEVVPNGVDLQQFRSDGSVRDPKQLLFLGSLDWRPNLDGIDQFLKTAFPKIVARDPQVRLTIVGRHPPQWLVERARADSHIELKSNVPDVVPYLSQAGLMVVPLRIGGGSRLKIIEAAANGLPVVSTRVGAEGLEFRPGAEYLVADGIPEMVDPVLQLLSDGSQREALAANAAQVAQRRYGWDGLAELQSAVWQGVACPTP